MRRTARRLVARTMGLVEHRRDHVGQRAHRLDARLHAHQHAPHVGVSDDRHARALGRRGVLALDAILGIGQGLLVGALGHAQPLHADAEARLVHHDEHIFETAVLLADQVADRARAVAEGEHRGRAGVDAHLVFDRDAAHVVARTERAIVVNEKLRHHEQRDALHALGRGGGAREHQVDDVVGEVMLAEADEDLLALDQVVVTIGRGLAADQAEVRAGLGLGQVHRAGPLARDHLVQEALLLLVAAAQEHRFDRPLGQQRRHRERHVRRVPHLHHRGVDQLGQPLAAEGGVEAQAVPARLDELGIRLDEALGRGDAAVVVALQALLVSDLVQRPPDLAGEGGGAFEHRIDEFGAHVAVAGQPGNRVEARQFVQHELHVLHRGGVGAHDGCLLACCVRVACVGRVRWLQRSIT